MLSLKQLLPLLVSALFFAGTSTSLFVPSLNKRIVNGFIMQQEFSPGMVSVLNDLGGYNSIAGGTLLSNRHVLTVAHGVRQLDKTVSPAQNVTVAYNSNSRENQIMSKVNKVTVFPDYLTYSNGTYDLAILEMDQIELGETAQRVPIYNGPIDDGQTMLTLGWGRTEEGAENTELLRGTYVYAGNTTMCQKFVKGFVDNNGPLICAPNILNPHSTICKGDSGTGVMVNQDGVLMIAGHASMIVNVGESECGNDTGSAFYTRIAYYLDFISETTGLSKDYLLGLTNDA
ncbi:hypothetical protein GGF40_003001 [Coemansia sp. RSA 1286]|nr:hypothetical protein GGF40_003001 [Coemansia sp. RSA 1286]